MGKIKPTDNSANQQNANKGNKGVNKQNAQVHGNRGKQINTVKKEVLNACKPSKEIRKYIYEKQKEYHKHIKEIIPLLQSEKDKLSKPIKKNSILSKTQSLVDKCKAK